MAPVIGWWSRFYLDRVFLWGALNNDIYRQMTVRNFLQASVPFAFHTVQSLAFAEP